MASYGEGSRAVIGINWNQGGGHVIVAERKNGKTTFVDPQAGIKYNSNALFSSIDPGMVRVIRVDNLKFTDRAKNAVEPAGGRR